MFFFLSREGFQKRGGIKGVFYLFFSFLDALMAYFLELFGVICLRVSFSFGHLCLDVSWLYKGFAWFVHLFVSNGLCGSFW